MPRKRRDVPWLEPHANGTYYACWYDAQARRTKRLSMGTQDASEAQARFARFLVDPDLREPARVVGLTTSQVLDDYRREHVAVKVIDKTRAESAIAHLKEFFKNTPIGDIDIPMSRQYRDARLKGKVGGGRRRKDKRGTDSTIRRELVVLNAAAQHAARWKRIGPNANPPSPMPSIELPPENQTEASWLTVAELKKAIDTAPTLRLKRFIKIVYYTAARRASIETLTKAQIDLKQGRINLRAPTEDALRRRSKKRRPIVPIHPEIRSDIELLMLESPNEYLWGDDNDMYRAFNDHMKAIGLGEKGFPHILRHTRATHLLQQGVSLYDVAKLLGDTHVTVERVYGHHCPDYLGRAIEEKAG